MSGLAPITVDEQEHYLATRSVTRCPTRTPAKLKSRKVDGPAVQRVLATFGKAENLPNFKFLIGSKVRTTNGTTVWTVLSQADTPAGTSKRSYRCSAGRMERIFGEDALRADDAPQPTKKLKVIDVALNPTTGEIEPVDPAVRNARAAVKSMLEASAALLAPTIDEPALFQVEPMTPKFAEVVTLKRVGKLTSPAPKAAGPSSSKPRLNAVFKPDQRVTVLVDKSPKNPAKKNHAWFQKVWDEVRAGRDTIASIVASDRSMPLMAEIKHAVAHGFMKVS